ncbi:hypothetical protein [Flavobacterium hungaricum]|uniref:Lipoprotein n=1 Tax=Flavobacterium hungaricum TaxID=2082725 RepID=A0ABR9TIF8_9FLAO|nr:hypothetical protein [Flavobacterium hungaricum]MBE8725061.1 hypothetical protein [Flavobacterium hungaricum]
MRYKTIFLAAVLCALSCTKKPEAKIKAAAVNKDTLNQEVYEGEYEGYESEEINLKQLDFPKSGKNAEAFVLEPCEIKMKAEGFLNDDTLKDIVIVLQNKYNNTDDRAVLVLLQQRSGEYKLQDISWEALRDGDFNDSEEISIDNEKKLHIMLQNVGPAGSRETVYKYVNNELVLVKIETFYAGAGSHLSSQYDLVSGKVDHEVTNTLHDSMPSEHQIKSFKLKTAPLFVRDNPEEILEKLPYAEW